MGDFAGALKLLGLVAVSLGVTVLVWMTIQSADLVFKPGKDQHPSQQFTAAIPQYESDLPPVQAPPAVYHPQPTRESQSGSNTIYKWVDSNGTLHFSDRPDQPKAQTVTVNPVTTFRAPDVQRPRVVHAGFSPSQERGQVRQIAYSSGPIFGTISAERVSWGIFQTSNGYHINAVAKHLGSRLSFEGRVEGGPACGTLKLVGMLANNQGKRHHFVAYAHDVGSGSRLFESHDRSVNWGKSGWEVEAISVACQER